MKTTFKFFAAALAIVAAASCSKEPNSPIDNNENQTLVELSFPATLNNPSDPSTKTTLAEDGISVHWTEGDAIFLYQPGTTAFNSSNHCQLDANGIEEDYTTFTGTGFYSNTYNAIYPYGVVNKNGSIQTIKYTNFATNTLANQYVQAGDFSKTDWGTSNIAIATGAANGERLIFNNVLAHFKFSIASPGVYSIVVSANQITDITYDSNPLSTQCDLGGTMIYGVSNSKIGPYNDTPITVTNKGEEFVVGETYYVAVPAVQMEGLTFTFNDADGNKLHSLTKSSTFTAEANKIYNLGSIEMPTKETAKVGDYFYTDGTYSTAYDSSKTLAGIVFYVGDGMKADETLMASEYSGCTNGLVVATSNTQITFAKSTDWKADGYMSTYGIGYVNFSKSRNENSYLMTGYNNTEVIRAVRGTDSKCIAYINDLPAVTGASSWFIPSFAEFDALYDNYAAISGSLNAIGASALNMVTYYSSTGYSYTTSQCGVYNLSNKGWSVANKAASDYKTIAIFAF